MEKLRLIHMYSSMLAGLHVHYHVHDDALLLNHP